MGNENRKYYCNDCGVELDEGEGSVFTCCDECWDKHYKKQQRGMIIKKYKYKKEKTMKDKLGIAHNNMQEVADASDPSQDNNSKRNDYRDNLILLIDILQNENPNTSDKQYGKMWLTLVNYILRNQ